MNAEAPSTGLDIAKQGNIGAIVADIAGRPLSKTGADSAGEEPQGAADPAPARALKKCECCGNSYDRSIEVVVDGESHTFDSFECAIHVLAPVCAMCGCRVIGHGIEGEGEVYCCAHCAREAGVTGVADNSDRPPD